MRGTGLERRIEPDMLELAVVKMGGMYQEDVYSTAHYIVSGDRRTALLRTDMS